MEVQLILYIIQQKIYGNEYEFYIIASNHELNDKQKLKGIKENWNTVGKAQVLYLPDEQMNIKNLLNQIENIRPDIIYLNSLFLYIFLFTSLKYKKKYDNTMITKFFKPYGNDRKYVFSDHKMNLKLRFKHLNMLV